MRAILPTISMPPPKGAKVFKSLVFGALTLCVLLTACQSEARKPSKGRAKPKAPKTSISPMAQFESAQSKVAATDWACMHEGTETRFMKEVAAQKLEVRLPRIRLLRAPYDPPRYKGAFCMRLKGEQGLLAPLYRQSEKASVWFIGKKGEGFSASIEALSLNKVKGPPRLVIFSENDLRVALLGL